MSDGVRVLIYGDVNLNVIDGSAIWLPAVAEAWARTGAEVHVQLKSVERRTLLSDTLRSIERVQVIEAKPQRGDSLSASELTHVVEQLDDVSEYDVIMVRGLRACRVLAQRARLARRLWSYVTEFSYGPAGFDDKRRLQIAEVAAASRFMLAQTEEARSVLEALVPEAAGKTLLLRPTVPDGLQAVPDVNTAILGTPERPLQLIYAGKFAKAWRTDQMPQLIPELRSLGVHATLTMVGDKVHEEALDPDWSARMRALMEQEADGVRWAGAVDRSTSLALIAAADLSLGWRAPDLDLSLEISTKVLESSALGVPCVLNHNIIHERVLGDEYPLYIDALHDGPKEIAQLIASSIPHLAELRARVADVVAPYRISSRADDLQGYLRRSRATAETGARHQRGRKAPLRPLRVLLAGHDLKFAGELVEMLENTAGIELRIDYWEALHRHDEAASKDSLAWADVVICEWAGSNAVWYSRHKRPHQRLIVRLHMFELRGRWLEDIRLDNVDRFVVVSQLTRDALLDRLSVEAERVQVIPNAVSLADFDRAGAPGREFRLGLVGFVPLLKRADRAVELLKTLRRSDPRYTLHFRGRMPWEYPHLWRKPEQRETYMDWFARVGSDPIRHAIAFEPFGPDMASWLRKIGWILSTSTTESFHLAPAEGMAAGALPVFWDRPGVHEIFGERFIVKDAASAATLIVRANADPDLRQTLEASARATVSAFDEQTVQRLWSELVFGR